MRSWGTLKTPDVEGIGTERAMKTGTREVDISWEGKSLAARSLKQR